MISTGLHGKKGCEVTHTGKDLGTSNIVCFSFQEKILMVARCQALYLREEKWCSLWWSLFPGYSCYLYETDRAMQVHICCASKEMGVPSWGWAWGGSGKASEKKLHEGQEVFKDGPGAHKAKRTSRIMVLQMGLPEAWGTEKRSAWLKLKVQSGR